jgi:hypothetical protein
MIRATFSNVPDADIALQGWRRAETQDGVPHDTPKNASAMWTASFQAPWDTRQHPGMPDLDNL